MSVNKGGRWCAAINCSNNSNINKELSFFRFPKDDARSKEWVIACRREDLLKKSTVYLYENCKICSVHFEDIMYLNFLKNRLKPEAVPTLFNIPNPPQLKCIKRKAPKIRFDNLTTKKQRTAADMQASLTISGSSSSISFETSTAVSPCSLDHSTNESRNSTRSQGQQTESIISSQSPRKQKLRLRIKQLQVRNRTLNKKISLLKSANKLSIEDITVEQFKMLCSKFLSEELARFIKVQIDLNKRAVKGRRYSLEFKKVALTIYFLSPKAYRFLSKIFYLPSKRSLQRLMEQWRYKPGVNNELISALKYKIDKLSDMGKYCVLCADEMSLKKFLFYSIKDDIVIGLHDTGMDVQLKPASSALVFMIRSIYSNWKQPVGYCFTANSFSGDELQGLIFNFIEQLESVGLNICGFITDMGSNFVQFSKRVGVTVEKPYFLVNNKKIHYLFDTPHLFKSLRNNLLNYEFQFGNKIALWKHVDDFYKKDKSQNLRLAPKLTDMHIYPNGFQKMKVKYAVQVFRHTVASALYTYVSLGGLESAAIGTAELLETFDKLFDLMNSNSMKSNKFYGRAWMGSVAQINFLNKSLQLIQSIVIKKHGTQKNVTKTVKFLFGFQVTINGFLNLWNSLKSSFSYVYTRRLNQDCLENLFCAIRQQGGNSCNPTPVQFVAAYKKLYCLNFFEHLESANCAEDLDVLLSKLNDDIVFKSVQSTEDSVCKPSTGIVLPTTDYRNSLPETNALNYVCGYLIRKCLDQHSCTICSNYAKEEANILNPAVYFNHYKAYENKNLDIFGNLQSPNINFCDYIGQLEKIFVHQFPSLLGFNVGQELLSIFDAVPFMHPCKEFPKQFLLKLFVRLRIYYCLKYLNREFKTKNTKCQKLLNVSHL